MTAKQIAEKAGCSVQRVYQLANQLGRLPTVMEVKDRQGKRGRPNIYKGKEEQENGKNNESN